MVTGKTSVGWTLEQFQIEVAVANPVFLVGAGIVHEFRKPAFVHDAIQWAAGRAAPAGSVPV